VFVSIFLIYTINVNQIVPRKTSAGLKFKCIIGYLFKVLKRENCYSCRRYWFPLREPISQTAYAVAQRKTIMGMQIANLENSFTIDDIHVVVGFKKDLIMERFPQLTYIYNPFFELLLSIFISERSKRILRP
jgi:hypothetical protein